MICFRGTGQFLTTQSGGDGVAAEQGIQVDANGLGSMFGKGTQNFCCPLAELRGALRIDPIADSDDGRQCVELIAVGFPVIRSLCKKCTY